MNSEQPGSREGRLSGKFAAGDFIATFVSDRGQVEGEGGGGVPAANADGALESHLRWRETDPLRSGLLPLGSG